MARWKLTVDGKSIVRVLETFNGDLYFIAEETGDEIFGYVRLYAMPECAEWGYSSLAEIRRVYGPMMVWDVTNENWPNLTTYNVEGLVVTREDEPCSPFSGGVLSNTKMNGAGLEECPEVEQLQPCFYFDDPSVPCGAYCYSKPLLNLRRSTSRHVHKRTKNRGLVRLGTYIEIFPEMWESFKKGTGTWSCCGSVWVRPDFPTRKYFLISRGLLPLFFYEDVAADPCCVNIQVSTDLDERTHRLTPPINRLKDFVALPKAMFRFKSTRENAALWADVVHELELAAGRVMETPIRGRVMETKLEEGHFAYGKRTALENAGWDWRTFLRCNTACKDCHLENGFLACAASPAIMARLAAIERPPPPRHTYELHAIAWGNEVRRALAELGGEGTNAEVYGWFEKNHPELALGKPSWRMKVRSALQRAAEPVDRGRWRLGYIPLESTPVRDEA